MITKFKLDLEHVKENEEIETETVEITMQETSPVIAGDIFTGNMSQSGSALVGSTVKAAIGTIIMSPKDLMDRIEKSDNPMAALGKVFKELNQFCAAPKRYVLLQRKSEQESSDVGEGTPQLDTNGNQPA
jgi:hypothetical protein